MKEEWVLVYFVTVYDPELLQLVEELDFFQPVNQFLFRAISQLIRKYKALPHPEIVLETFKKLSFQKLTTEETRQAIEFFNEWANCSWGEGDRKYIEESILKWLKQRRAQRILQKASQLISTDKVDSIPSLVKSLSRIEKSSEVIDLLASTESRIKEWQLMRQQFGIPTPFTLGAFSFVLPGEVALIIAPPKIGKSFLLNWVGAHAIVVGKVKVAHFTLEMPAVEVAMRYDLNLVNQYGQSPLKLTEENYANNIPVVQKYLSYFLRPPALLKLIDIPSKRATFSVLEAKYDQLCDVIGDTFNLVLIDYANLIKSENIKDRSKLYSIGTDVFEWLHDFAKEKKVAVWTIARTTREAMRMQEANRQKKGLKERVKGSQIGHSYAIIYDCDHVVTISDLTQFEDAQVRKSRIFDISLDYSRRCSSYYGFQVELHYPTVTFFSPPISKISRASSTVHDKYPEANGE